MESSEKFELKLKQLRRAILTFERTLAIESSKFNDPDVEDAIDNGKIQKFVYTMELLWKAMRFFLESRKGVKIRFAKEVMKEFFLAGYIPNDTYETLFNAWEDRNQLSHEYYEEFLEDILPKLPEYFSAMKASWESLDQQAKKV